MQPITLNLHRVSGVVAAHFDIRVQYVLGHYRDLRANQARDFLYAVLMHHDLSIAEIVAVMGRHRSTVMTARKRVAKKLADPGWRETLTIIINTIRYSPANNAYSQMH